MSKSLFCPLCPWKTVTWFEWRRWLDKSRLLIGNSLSWHPRLFQHLDAQSQSAHKANSKTIIFSNWEQIGVSLYWQSERVLPVERWLRLISALWGWELSQTPTSSPREARKVASSLHAERIIGVIPAANYPHQWPMLWGGLTPPLGLRLLPRLNSQSSGCMWGEKNIKVTEALNESPPTK